MQVGQYKVTTHVHDFLRLDGGAMFGVVPKTIWERVAPADDLNRILLATRSLIIEEGDRKLVVDLGCGDKWNAKTRAIFDASDKPYEPIEGVTDVLFTHLHFDHSGGVSRIDEVGDLVLNYPFATHYVSRPNYENGLRPNVRERASYLPENVNALAQAKLTLLETEQEVWRGLTVHRADGHTDGLFWVTLCDGGTTVAFPSDLCPTSHHLPVVYTLGYDICTKTCMIEKQAFLEQAIAEQWIVVFQHDPEVCAAKLGWDDRGRPVVTERLDI